MKHTNPLPFLTGSISRKYGMGYFLILAMMLVIFTSSLISSSVMANQYSTALNDLLDLNTVFIEVEEANRALYDCVMYLRENSMKQCDLHRNSSQALVDSLLVRMETEYSRDVMDLCYTVQTYLSQNEELINILYSHIEGEPVQDDLQIQELYSLSQESIAYINLSFKEIYSAKLVSTNALQARMMVMRRIFNLAQIALLLAALGMVFLFYRQVVEGISRSVKRLTSFAGRLTSDPMRKEHVLLNTGDELELFADGFNNMVDTIQTQFEQIKDDQRIREQLQAAELENMRISSALQNSQLRLLQSRINPHFLFNTLNMISQTAYMENAEETAGLIEATASFLRYNLGKISKPVTLGDEIANLREYVYIQQCRYGSRIAFQFETEEGCMEQEIPSMILQPLVENSIKYGVGKMLSGGRITVRAYRRAQTCYLEVEDNGEGMLPETLQALRNALSDQSDDGEHIGLRNVYMRLMLYFDHKINFQLNSEKNYTLIQLGIPWRILKQGE